MSEANGREYSPEFRRGRCGRWNGSCARRRRCRRSGEAEARVIALYEGQPPKGYANWSLRLLAGKVVELGIVDARRTPTRRELPGLPSALWPNRGERIRLEKSGGTGAIPSDFVDLSLDDEAAHRAGRYRRCRSSRGGDNGLWASSHQVCGRPEPTHRSWHRQWVCACPAFPAFPRR